MVDDTQREQVLLEEADWGQSGNLETAVVVQVGLRTGGTSYHHFIYIHSPVSIIHSFTFSGTSW
jgi:hypothetical protein